MDIAALKKSLRITHDKLDDDIMFNVEACKADMRRVGIGSINDDDFAIRKLVELYLKWQYNFMADGERFEKAYKCMRNGISLCGDYSD